MAEVAVVQPEVMALVLALLRSRSRLTDAVGQRIARSMPSTEFRTRWPAIRVTEIVTVETTRRRIWRTLVQFDCWGLTDDEADQLARDVAAELRAASNFATSEAVVLDVTDVAVRRQPDGTLSPAQPRSIVTCHLSIQPRT